jgi:hypothetical protein
VTIKPGRLVINEVDYDQVGTDLNEFVEIFNGTGRPVELSNLALVLSTAAPAPRPSTSG